ncbi:hypothetical protein JCM1840_007302 [Sporobolomyces johnsonii]
MRPPSSFDTELKPLLTQIEDEGIKRYEGREAVAFGDWFGIEGRSAQPFASARDLAHDLGSVPNSLLATDPFLKPKLASPASWLTLSRLYVAPYEMLTNAREAVEQALISAQSRRGVIHNLRLKARTSSFSHARVQPVWHAVGAGHRRLTEWTSIRSGTVPFESPSSHDLRFPVFGGGS